MKKILNVLKNPWLIGLTGFAAVVALIWYLGPLISVAGASPFATDLGRIITIVVFGVLSGTLAAAATHWIGQLLD